MANPSARWELEQKIEQMGKELSRCRRDLKHLQKQAEKYRLLFDNMSEGFALHEAILDDEGRVQDFRILDMNAACERNTGLKRSEMMGRRIRKIHSDTVWIERYAKVVLSGQPARYREYSAVLDRWLEVFVYTPGPGQCAVIFTDITKHNQAEEAQKDSRTFLRILLNTLPDLVWLKDGNGVYLSCNSRFESLAGKEEDEIIGKTDYDLWDRDLAEFFREKDQIAVERGKPVRNEENVVFHDGHAEILETIKTPMYTADGRLTGVLGIGRDITDRKLAEEELKEALLRQNEAVRAANVGLWDWDLGTDKTRYSDEWKRQLGYEPHEIKDDLEEWKSRVHPHDLGPVLEEVQAEIARGALSGQLEFRLRHKDGAYRWMLAQGSVFRDDAGRPVRILGSNIDITEKKKAEATLRYHDHLLQEMGRIAKVGGWEFNPADGTGTWTEEVARIHGLDPDEETNMEKGLDFYRDESRTKIREAVKNASEKGIPYDLELELVTAAGARKWVRTIGKPKVINGRVVQVRGSFQDITEIKQARERIEHLNNVLRTIRDVNQLIVRERDPDSLIREACRLLVENRGYASSIILVTDNDGQLVSWARAGAIALSDPLKSMLDKGEIPYCCAPRKTGGQSVTVIDRKEGCGDCPMAVTCPGKQSLWARMVNEGKLLGYLVADLDHDMKVDDEEQSLFFEMAGDLAYALNVMRMDTARKDAEHRRDVLEKQLIHSQKMESVGRLAGGVAHDYNNMLSVIVGYAEMAMEKLNGPDPVRGDLAEILKAANRSAAITRQLLAFARQQPVSPEILDLNKTVKGMLTMFRRLIGEDIDLAWRPHKGLLPVRIDPSQIDQILANLCVNARDSITGVGRIAIETRAINLDEDYCARQPGVVPGEFAMLAVGDDGCGMGKELQDKIFEPFFTTKETGKGTGLGLATVYGIVQQNNGFITIDSQPGQGSTFKIHFPVYAGDTLESRATDSDEPPGGRGELVLVVEDEPLILSLTEKMLAILGYKVLAAKTPAQAIALAESATKDISLLITDVVMPKMNGRDLAEKLRGLHPHIRTLFMSGYTADIIAKRGVLEKGVNFIQKPFAKQELAKKIQAVMRAETQTGN